MPKYEYKCKCGKEFERSCIKGLRHAQFCECGEFAKMDITKSMPALTGFDKYGRSQR